MLHSLGRIDLLLPLRDWLENAVARPLVERVGVSPEIPPTEFGGDCSHARSPSLKTRGSSKLQLWAR